MRGGRREKMLTEEEELEVRRLYCGGGHSFSSLSKELSLPYAVVAKACLYVDKSRKNKARDMEICRLYRDTGFSQTQIARLKHVTQSCVSQIIRKHGVRKQAREIPAVFEDDDVRDVPRHPCRAAMSRVRVCAHGVNGECYLWDRCSAHAAQRRQLEIRSA